MATYNLDLQRFQFLQTIVTSRAAGSNDYSQATMLTALEACMSEYLRITIEHGHELSEDEFQQLNAKIESLSRMQMAERDRGDVPVLPVSSSNNGAPSSSPSQENDNPFPDWDSDASMSGDELNVSSDEDMQMVEPEPEISDDDETPDFDAMTYDELNQYLDEEIVDLPQSRDVTLTQRQLTESDRHDDGTLECPITQEEMELGDTVSALSCGHFFYPENLQRWMETSMTCPTCRAIITDQ